MFAEVALNIPLHHTYHYHVPPDLANVVQEGVLVRVAFGTAAQAGVVLALHDTSPIAETKPIQAVLDAQPVLNHTQIALARWISNAYYAPIGLCVWLWLPPALTGKSERVVELLDDSAAPDDASEWAIVSALRVKSPLPTARLEREVGKGFRKALKQLEATGVVRVFSRLSRSGVRPKTEQTVTLLLTEEELHARQLSRRQRRIVDALQAAAQPLAWRALSAETGAARADLLKLEAAGVVGLSERIVYRDILADRDYTPTHAPPLTPEQAHAAARIEKGGLFLLHGVTGSGKTEIYLHAIAHALAQGKGALFLVPEIALTPQTVQRVAARFPQQVAIVHSSLSIGERYDTWQRARMGEVRVIVGTRSALFTPLPELGVIVLDEEHDPSYKQAPPIQPPYYHARAVAEQLARYHHATLILGSATPDLEVMYRAQRGELTYLHLPNRVLGHQQRVQSQAQRIGVRSQYQPLHGQAMMMEMPPVQVIDMRAELREGNTHMFSRLLHSALADTLARGEQAILFLNRRGQATYVFCRDCGAVTTCPRCDTPMTYHRQGEAMRCHHCGYIANPPTTCRHCGSTRIKYFGAGTQQVEEELLKQFPQARSVRWDADTASKHDDHEVILARFANHEADVLIGTQMVAKGLDLPLVTLVGVVNADWGLALPDFRAQERVFQLLMQVAGRAGRSVLSGRVILQTYQPNHVSVLAASQHNYDLFYQQELQARREMGYPPFRRLVRLLCQGTHPYEVQRHAEALAEQLRGIVRTHQLGDTQVMAAVPCFFGRINLQYRWQVLLRSPDPLHVLRHLPQPPRDVYIDVDPVDLL